MDEKGIGVQVVVSQLTELTSLLIVTPITASTSTENDDYGTDMSFTTDWLGLS